MIHKINIAQQWRKSKKPRCKSKLLGRGFRGRYGGVSPVEGVGVNGEAIVAVGGAVQAQPSPRLA